MPIPHAFPSLLSHQGGRYPVLIVGAGMSFGIAPSVWELESEIDGNYTAICTKLGVNPGNPPVPGNELEGLYGWAERALNCLQRDLKLSEDDAKLRFASAVGISDDDRFHARVSIPLRGTTPRHRVVARFARESRWSEIWSLNWDYILESALEQIGLRPHPAPGTSKPNPLPWNQWFCIWTPYSKHRPFRNAGTVSIIKPHGCVKELQKGNPLFVVTRTELTKLPVSLNAIVSGPMFIGFSREPLVAVGWKATEGYIQDLIAKVKRNGLLSTEGDRLSIVDVSWHPTVASHPPTNHAQLADSYDVAQSDCFFDVKTVIPNTDALFQWLQTRFGLQIMYEYASALGPAWEADRDALQDLLNIFAEPQPTNWVNSFFDSFLPVWARFCFNAGGVVYYNNSAPIATAIDPTYRRDEHIPWSVSTTNRADLVSAIPLLLSLWRAATVDWNFDEFPGALWNVTKCFLIVPIPGWINTTPIAAAASLGVAAVQPLMDDRNWPNKSSIAQLAILPVLNAPTGYAPVSDPHQVLRTPIAREIKFGRFVDASKIEVADLGGL